MRLKILSLFLTIFPTFIFGQSFGSERVDKIKSSVVRILVDDKPTGTGFLVNQDGWLATCWHVIEPAMIRDTNNNIIRLKKMSIEFFNGEKVEIGILTQLLNDGYADALSFDYSFLKIQSIPKTKFSFLKLGSFKNIREGDAHYSCGYPLGIKQQFISSGILSTKWVDTIILKRFLRKDSLILRDVAWLDLTMNKGNSGGPIIKIGKTVDEDEVVGISSFILNPFAKASSDLVEYLTNIPANTGAFFSGISFNEISKLFGSAIANNSIGVSGCISIDHFINGINKVTR